MSTPGALMEPTTAPTITTDRAGDARLISVVVPVVERTDDLVAVYHAFAGELDPRPEDYECFFVYDGRSSRPRELLALSRDGGGFKVLRFGREFGEPAALRLGIE